MKNIILLLFLSSTIAFSIGQAPEHDHEEYQEEEINPDEESYDSATHQIEYHEETNETNLYATAQGHEFEPENPNFEYEESDEIMPSQNMEEDIDEPNSYHKAQEYDSAESQCGCHRIRRGKCFSGRNCQGRVLSCRTTRRYCFRRLGGNSFKPLNSNRCINKPTRRPCIKRRLGKCFSGRNCQGRVLSCRTTRFNCFRRLGGNSFKPLNSNRCINKPTRRPCINRRLGKCFSGRNCQGRVLSCRTTRFRCFRRLGGNSFKPRNSSRCINKPRSRPCNP